MMAVATEKKRYIPPELTSIPLRLTDAVLSSPPEEYQVIVIDDGDWDDWDDLGG